MQNQYPTPGGTPGKPSANSQQDPTPPTPADSTDKRAAPSQTGAWPLTPTQFQDTNQFQASGRQILPSDQALAPPADLYQPLDANQFQLSAQRPTLAPPADLFQTLDANQFHAPDQLIPPGLQLPTQPSASNQPQALYQPQASNQLQASYEAHASYRPHISTLMDQRRTQIENFRADRGKRMALATKVYIDDLLQQFNDVREGYGVSGSEGKVDYETFCDRIFLDLAKITPPEPLGEMKDRESRCHIGFTAAMDSIDPNTDPNDKSRWVYLRYCMETTDDVQKNWRFEKHFGIPIARSMMTLLPGLDVIGAKFMVLRHINWWQSQAYMGYHKEQIICAARRRLLKGSGKDHLEAEDLVVLPELKLATDHFMQFEHYSEEDSAVLKLVLRQPE